jgi:hypothetical protein
MPSRSYRGRLHALPRTSWLQNYSSNMFHSSISNEKMRELSLLRNKTAVVKQQPRTIALQKYIPPTFDDDWTEPSAFRTKKQQPTFLRPPSYGDDDDEDPKVVVLLRSNGPVCVDSVSSCSELSMEDPTRIVVQAPIIQIPKVIAVRKKSV